MLTRWTRNRLGRLPPAVLLLFLASACGGCVERLLQIRSEPPGAEVYVNGERVGVTPVDHPFEFYGTFDITLRSKDHLSERRLESVRPPWYQIPPLDFLTENMLPFKFKNRHEVRFLLEPVKPLEDEELEREKRESLERVRAFEEKMNPPPGDGGKD